MAEYASKGQGTAGVTLGTIGTVLGGLVALNGGTNGGGVLNGLFGCNGNNLGISNALAEKDAKIAELTAQKYSDNQDAILYKATREENKSLRDEIMGCLKPIASEVSSLKSDVGILGTTIAKNAEISDLKEKLVRKDIDALAVTVANNTALLNSITKTIVPKDAICPEYMSRYNSWVAPTTTTGN